MNASLNWLQNRWGLPEAALQSVRQLMEVEACGGTACELGQVPDFGHAALPPDAPKDSPLVLIQTPKGTWLQSRAMFIAESTIAHRLLALAQTSFPPVADLDAQIEALFPKAMPDDRQAAAARVAATRALLLLTGGPGTGKTYTLARILALLVATGTRIDAIRLAAPTGKAAQRMSQAISDSLATLPAKFENVRQSLQAVATTCSTLHSLLGYHPGDGVCRPQPLPEDAVLILDECSMIDIYVWQALIRHLPSRARLVLIGDPDQLESVGQGNAFAEIIRAAAELPLRSAHVHLTESRRFKNRPAIQALAQTLRNRDAAGLAELLRKCTAPEGREGVLWIPHKRTAPNPADFPESVLDALRGIAYAPSAGEALAALGKICILVPHRRFSVGSEALGRRIQTFLSQNQPVLNTPIIIQRNDSETGLRNGSLGILRAAPDGARVAYFEDGNGGVRKFSIARLPEHTFAWAITIHRSQGSEYDEVLVAIPTGESPLVSRELLYTAITRAKSRVVILGDLDTLCKAAVSTSGRTSLLAFQFGFSGA